MSNKTEQWVIFTFDGDRGHPKNGEGIACPVAWLAHEASHYEGARVVTEEYVRGCASPDVEWALEPGVFAKCDGIDDLYMCVNYVYTLVDEGYLDGDKALLAFKEVKGDGPANLNKWEAANTCPVCKGADGECLEDDNMSGTGWSSMRCNACDCEWTIDYETAVIGITVTTKEVPSE